MGMKIIIVAGDAKSATPRVAEISPATALLAALLIVALLAWAVDTWARRIAASWVETRAPIAMEIVAEIEEREVAARREESRRNLDAFSRQLSGLCAGMAELQGRGIALAERLGLEGFFDDAPIKCDTPPGGAPARVQIADDASSSETSHHFSDFAEFDVAPAKTSAAPADTFSGGDQNVALLPETELNALIEASEFIHRRYDVMARHGSDVAVDYDTVPMVKPLGGRSWQSSPFGWRRDPFTGRRAWHAGYDYGARPGTPVLAGATGIVSYGGWLGNYGNAIRIRHGKGVSTLYGHLSVIGVKAGDYVRRGDIIGRVGNTGRSTAPHLHYEIRVNNRPQAVRQIVSTLRKERSVPPKWGS